MSDEADLIAANSGFYAAFAAGDYAVMERLWASEVAVSCVHPGWPPVDGREKVLSTWRGILADPPKPAIRSLQEKARLLGDVGMVVCFEAIGDTYLVATNLFVRENGTWKIVHHQAAVTGQAPQETKESASIHRLH